MQEESNKKNMVSLKSLRSSCLRAINNLKKTIANDSKYDILSLVQCLSAGDTFTYHSRWNLKAGSKFYSVGNYPTEL